jgi:hypothetical protein
MSNGHEDFMSTIKRLQLNMKVTDAEFLSEMIVHFDQRLTAIEDTINEVTDEEEL